MPVVNPMGAGPRRTSAVHVHTIVPDPPQRVFVEATSANEPFDSEAPRHRLGTASVRSKKWAR